MFSPCASIYLLDQHVRFLPLVEMHALSIPKGQLSCKDKKFNLHCIERQSPNSKHKASSMDDFLIIGAGIFGLTTAIELQKRGYQVSLLAGGPIPHPKAASTDISKIVRMEYGSDAFYMDMADRCIDEWHAWNDLFQEELYREVGFLLACSKPMEAETQPYEHSSFHLLQARGHQPEHLVGDLISKRFPAFASRRYVDGFYHKRAGYALAGRTIEVLAKYAQSLGVEVKEAIRVKELLIENSQAKGVTSEKGEKHLAGHTIVCAGAHTAFLVPDLQPFMQVTGHPVFHLRPRNSSLFESPKLPVFAADISHSGWYGFPYHPHEHVVKIANHGVGQVLHPDRDPREVREADVQHLRTFLQTAFPKLHDAPIVYTRRCLYMDTLDGHFWIDRHPRIGNLMIGTGGSGHGFKMGPELGKLIAAAALGEKREGAERFRWRELGGQVKGEEEARFRE